MPHSKQPSQVDSISRRSFLKQTALALGAASFAGSARAAESKTILLRSAWQTINIGDIGHTPGTLHIIEKHLPDVHVILWPSKINDPVRELLMKRFPKLEIIEGGFAKKKGPVDSDLRQAFDRAGLVIRNSGMGQDTDWMNWCKDTGKPFGVYGQSYFPNFVEGHPENVELLNAAKFVYCRDGQTLGMLQKLNLKTPVLEFGPDGCFGIDVRDDDRALAFMKKAGLEDKKFMTIQQRTNTGKLDGSDAPLNPKNPTDAQKADDERRAAKYREVITAWVKKTGMKVLIAPEVDKEIGHNKRLLFDPLPADIQAMVVNRETFWNADEAASVFARARACVCHEPHSLIIALANGTPIIHTYSAFHSPKCYMFKDIGLPEWLLEFDSTPAGTIFDTLMAISDDQPGAEAKVKKAMDYVASRQADSMAVVRKLLATA